MNGMVTSKIQFSVSRSLFMALAEDGIYRVINQSINQTIFITPKGSTKYNIDYKVIKISKA